MVKKKKTNKKQTTFIKEQINNPQLVYESLFQKDKILEQYPKPDWAIKQIVRESGLVEDICKHFLGHPNQAWLKKNDPKNIYGFGVHGCDNCCSNDNKK